MATEIRPIFKATFFGVIMVFFVLMAVIGFLMAFGVFS